MNVVVDAMQWILESFVGLPVLVLIVLALPLVAIGHFLRTYPYKQFMVLFAPSCLLTVGLLLRHDLFPLIVTLDVTLVLLATWDLMSLPGPQSFAVERSCQKIASLRKSHPVLLTITYRGAHDFLVWVRDDRPEGLEATPPEFMLRLTARSRTTVRYELQAHRRGAFELQRVYVRVRSRWGFWRRYLEYPAPSALNVYPDMQQLSEYAVLARTNRLSLMGVRQTRRIGQDHEFERLRDYTLDDNYKHIDWRTTARRRKLTVKDFQTSQSQRLIFLVDCGRMMTNEASGLSLLDHALNAMLMLSFVALRQGDSVGMMGFSDSVHAFVPPRGGMTQMNRLLHASFDRFPELVESRYDQAFLYLAAHCQKRSLVILITNVIDEVNAHQVHRYLGALSGRHLPLGVMLRDHRLFDAADTVQPQGEDLFRAAAAAEILTWRNQVLRELEHHGVLALDVFPEKMTAPLVNEYLEIKARHLL